MAAGGLEPETFGPTSASLTAKLAITAESDKAMDQNRNDAGCAGGTETANDCQNGRTEETEVRLLLEVQKRSQKNILG